MNALKNKIKSQRGASITFALLLFLVCAIISGIVVVAATAAAGRMSQRAEIDQRYYAVISAGGLLRDDFNGKAISVQYKITGGSSSTPPEATKLIDTITSEIKQLSDYVILKDASEIMVTKLRDELLVNPQKPDREFELTSDLTTEHTSLGCTVNEYVNAGSKQVRFVISNTPPTGVANPQKYTLEVVFNANLSQSTSEYTHNNMKETIVSTDIAWKLANIKKGAA